MRNNRLDEVIILHDSGEGGKAKSLLLELLQNNKLDFDSNLKAKAFLATQEWLEHGDDSLAFAELESIESTTSFRESASTNTKSYFYLQMANFSISLDKAKSESLFDTATFYVEQLRYPSDTMAEASIQLGEYCVKIGRFSKAFDHFQDAIDRSKCEGVTDLQRANALTGIAQCQRKKGEKDDAALNFQRAIELLAGWNDRGCSVLLRICSQLAVLYHEQGKVRQGMQVLGDVVAKAEPQPATALLRCYAHCQLADFKRTLFGNAEAKIHLATAQTLLPQPLTNPSLEIYFHSVSLIIALDEREFIRAQSSAQAIESLLATQSLAPDESCDCMTALVVFYGTQHNLVKIEFHIAGLQDLFERSTISSLSRWTAMMTIVANVAADVGQGDRLSIVEDALFIAQSELEDPLKEYICLVKMAGILNEEGGDDSEIIAATRKAKQLENSIDVPIHELVQLNFINAAIYNFEFPGTRDEWLEKNIELIEKYDVTLWNQMHTFGLEAERLMACAEWSGAIAMFRRARKLFLRCLAQVPTVEGLSVAIEQKLNEIEERIRFLNSAFSHTGIQEFLAESIANIEFLKALSLNLASLTVAADVDLTRKKVPTIPLSKLGDESSSTCLTRGSVNQSSQMSFLPLPESKFRLALREFENWDFSLSDATISIEGKKRIKILCYQDSNGDFLFYPIVADQPNGNRVLTDSRQLMGERYCADAIEAASANFASHRKLFVSEILPSNPSITSAELHRLLPTEEDIVLPLSESINVESLVSLLKEELGDLGNYHATFVGDTNIGGIPIGALWANSNHRIYEVFDSVSYGLSLKSHTSQELTDNEDDSPFDLSGIVVGVSGEGKSHLGFVKTEIDVFNQQVGEEEEWAFLVGSTATRDSMRQYHQCGNILWLAGHGSVGKDHLGSNGEISIFVRPSFELFDGPLSDARMIEEKYRFHSKSLIHLSCCVLGANFEADFGKQLDGFISTMAMLGARRVSCAAWEVHDESAAMFGAEFMQQIRKSNKQTSPITFSRAFKNAIENLRSITNDSGEKRFDHELFWAPWILVGPS